MIYYHDMFFSAVGQTRKLHIYLPDDYDISNEHYPVMYFFDGQNLFFDQEATYGKSWGLNAFLQSWSKKMIVVGLECGHQRNERISEYCPYDIDSNFFSGSIQGLGQLTMDWLVGEVKPFIDSNYRTYSFRQTTGIAGSSMGGLMAIYGLAKYNHVFSKAACLSSVIFNELEEDLAQTSIDSNTRIYLSWGSQEAQQTDSDNLNTFLAHANLRVEAYFQNQGAASYVYCQEGGRHNEADWEKQVPSFMDFLWMQ